MPNNVLFPSNDPAKDFAHDNDNIDRGWIKIADNENLGTMAAAIPKEVEKDNNAGGNNDGNVAKKASNPKSIPSPIAHIKAFKNDLENNVPEVVNEWRGMLAAIALQKLQGVNISVKQRQLHTPNAPNTGVLGEIVYESLIGNPEITGYTDERALDSLYVFCKDDKPFAMYMPSMVICPFKEYEKEIFNGLPWLERDNQEWVWKAVDQCQDMKNGNEISKVGVKLHSWLKAIHDTYNYNPIQTFYEDLEKIGEVGNPINLVPTGYDTEIPQAGNNDPINKAAPSPDGAPETVFSDKLLFVVPPAVGSGQGNVDGDIDKNGIGVFCPKKLSIEGNNIGGNNVVYVVPPITDEVVQKLKAAPAAVAPQLVNKDWEITNDGNEKFVVKFQLFYPGTDETVTHSHEYSAQDVMWTSDMPYISMWPYVGLQDGLWKDYMVSLFVKRGKAEYGANAFSYKADLSNPITVYGDTPFIQGQYGKNNVLIGEEVNGVTTTCMQIDVVAGQNANKQTFKCESSFRIGTDENQKFRIIKTESMPWAISFAYSRGNRTYTLGCWMIVPPPANNQGGGNQNAVAKIAMDFGTTSTNVFISVGNNQPRSINSPSKYVHHIYDPLAGQEKIYQRYYLFGAEPDAHAAAYGVQNGGQAVNVSLLGKIATYGQNLISVDTNGDSATTGEPNIAGRFIEVDKQYMMSSNSVDDGIYNGLKWDDGNNNQGKEDVRKNFISTLLNCAMLEARMAGANSVELGLSYPCESTNTAAQKLQQAVSELTAAGILRRNAGNMTITPYYETESKSAGKYFCDIFAPNNNNQNARVYPQMGYTVVDIGGGTTDISFWRGSGNNPVEMKSQHSFLFAGSNIIERTFIDFFGDTANDSNQAGRFKGFWANNNCDESDRFITVQRDPNNPSYYYLRKSLVLNFLLEKSAFNTNAFNQLVYNDLFQAIRAKYYALFYLVASYLKADKVYDEPLPNNTSFCLAGCGSKGIRTFCCSTDTKFENNICELVKKFSYDIGNVYLVEPYTENKEEVVIGLSKLDAGNNNRQPVVVAGDGATPIGDNDDDKDNIKRSLEELLDTIMDFEQNVPNKGDVLQRVKGSFDNEFDTQYDNVIGMAVADTVESCAVMILDRMITKALT